MTTPIPQIRTAPGSTRSGRPSAAGIVADRVEAPHDLTLALAGLEIDVIFTPGHSPGHVTYAVADEGALFSGDVLFEGSIGRTDLPGGDYGVLMQDSFSIVPTSQPSA